MRVQVAEEEVKEIVLADLSWYWDGVDSDMEMCARSIAGKIMKAIDAERKQSS